MIVQFKVDFDSDNINEQLVKSSMEDIKNSQPQSTLQQLEIGSKKTGKDWA